MRFVLSLFVLLAFSAPSFASENNEIQMPILVKGSKPYQMRYSKADASPAAVEPAAGIEMGDIKSSEHAGENLRTNEEMSPKKVMKLHGKR